MIKQAVNTFTNGINSDLSLSVIPNNNYTSANNVRVITQSGSTTGSLENVIGNEFSFNLPSCRSVWKLTVPLLRTSSYIITVTTNLNTYTSNIGNASIDNVAIWLTNTFGSNIFYKKSQDNDFIFYLLNEDVTSITLQNSTPPSTVIDIGTQLTPYISKPIVIGSIKVRDYTYVFSTDDSNSGSGQIWKVNSTDSIIVPELLYNNVLNFSTEHLIPSTGVVGRYENDGTIHIYFTDYNNTLRSCNVADPDLFAMPVSQFNLVPDVNLTSPILNDIKTSGRLRTGVYNIGYKLKNNFGDESQLSSLTGNIFIFDNTPNVGSDPHNTYGSATIGNTSSQSIDITIPYTDSSYNLISVYLFYRDSLTGTTKVFHVTDDNIPANGGLYNITISNDISDYNTITIDEATQPNTAFLQAKTIVAKDNVLYAGNTRTDAFDLNWDARAYRWNRSTNSSYVSPDYDKSDWGIASDADVINPFNTDFDDNSTVNYAYQIPVPSGKQGSALSPSPSTIGGNGPNVKYDFFNFMEGESYQDDDVGSYKTHIPSTGGSYTFDSSLPNVAYGDYCTTFKDNHAIASFKGYARGDVYRFGIVFFDKTGNRSFVKWIGDIKFPEVPLTSGVNSSNNMSSIQLGIHFTLDLSTIKDQISGYRFVRVKRTEADKSRLGMGLWFPNAVTEDPHNNLFIKSPYVRGHYDFTVDKQLIEIGDVSGTQKSNVGHTGTIQVPDWLFKKNIPSVQAGDKIRGVHELDSGGGNFISFTIPSLIINKLVTKYYNYASGNSFVNKITGNDVKQAPIDTLTRVGVQGSGGTITAAGLTFTNNVGSIDNNSSAIPGSGAETAFITIGSNINFKYSKFNSFYSLPVLSYVRPRSFYYGGDDYISRSNNEYVPCSPIYSVNANNNSDIRSTYVLEGDTYVNLFDNVKIIGDWSQGSSVSNAVDREIFGVIFPCETSVNTDLRYGATICNLGTTNNPVVSDENAPYATSYATISFGSEEYNYNPFYDIENDIITYIPKPFNFIANEIHDCRVWYSDVKSNGELIDSWRVFRQGNYHDLDYQFGPLTSLVNHNNKVFGLQENAVSLLSINEKVIIPDAATLVLGSGEGIQRHDYLTNSIGTKHQNSVLLTPDHVYFYDTKHKSIMRFNGQELSLISDLKGLYNEFNTLLVDDINNQDNPLYGYGVSVGYDFKFNEVLYSFKDTNNSFTVVYNTLTNAFTSFYSILPYMYMQHDDRLWSINTNNKHEFYEHNKGNRGYWFNTYYDSDITFVTNENYNYSKVFDNLSIMHETYINDVDDLTTFKDIQAVTTYQDTNVIPLTVNGNIKQRERTWRLAIPRNGSNTDRIRDKYVKVKLTWENDSRNRTLILHDVATSYRVSPR